MRTPLRKGIITGLLAGILIAGGDSSADNSNPPVYAATHLHYQVENPIQQSCVDYIQQGESEVAVGLRIAASSNPVLFICDNEYSSCEDMIQTYEKICCKEDQISCFSVSYNDSYEQMDEMIDNYGTDHLPFFMFGLQARFNEKYRSTIGDSETLATRISEYITQ